MLPPPQESGGQPWLRSAVCRLQCSTKAYLCQQHYGVLGLPPCRARLLGLAPSCPTSKGPVPVTFPQPWREEGLEAAPLTTGPCWPRNDPLEPTHTSSDQQTWPPCGPGWLQENSNQKCKMHPGLSFWLLITINISNGYQRSASPSPVIQQSSIGFDAKEKKRKINPKQTKNGIKEKEKTPWECAGYPTSLLVTREDFLWGRSCGVGMWSPVTRFLSGPAAGSCLFLIFALAML